MTPGPGTYDLILATSQLPIADGTDPVLSRARGALMHAVASRGGTWMAATGTPRSAAASSWLLPLEMSCEALAGWRDGHCATTLASAYFGHSGITPVQDPVWRAAYEEVNAGYAEAIAQRAADGAAIWLHDHPLQLVPAMLRRLRPDLRIGFTLHSPLPPAESFRTLAGHEELLAGLASADLVSFTDERSQANFTALADEAGAARGRTVVMPMPANGHAIAHLAETPAVQAHAARIRAQLRPATIVFLSVGASDPSDGTLRQLQEFARLLDTGGLNASRCAFLLLAPAADSLIPDVAQWRTDLERLTAQINGQHGRLGHLPVHYQRGSLTPAELAAFYLAADVMLATPMRDRATPLAAEFAATRASGHGRVVLSEFSATRLPGAAVVNPHEPEALGDAMLAAAACCHTASPQVASMRDHVLAASVTAWADEFLRSLTGGRPANGRLLQTRRALPPLRFQEGPRQRAQASDTPDARQRRWVVSL